MCLAPAHALNEKVGACKLWHDADAHEDETEFREGGGDDHVERQDLRDTNAEGGAIHSRDARF